MVLNSGISYPADSTYGTGKGQHSPHQISGTFISGVFVAQSQSGNTVIIFTANVPKSESSWDRG